MENKNQQHRSTNRLPTLSKKQIFLMTFGFFGTQIAFAMQTGTMGRIFQTIGADPNQLGFFFILPPMAGLIMQPLIGYFSDRTWLPRLGRRMPYLIGGTTVAVIVLLLMPSAGSFGFGYGSMAALLFAGVTVLFIDLSCNVIQQPFKMIIPDMANDEQAQTLWSMQNVWGSLGALTAFAFPFLLTALGVANHAKIGEIPPSVRISYYIAAVILIIATGFTVLTVKEYSPEELRRYHGLSDNKLKEPHKDKGLGEILKRAPKTFWLLGLAAFFVWIAIPYMWTYSTGALAEKIWQTTDPTTPAYQEAGNWFGFVQGIYCVVSILTGLFFAKIKASKRRLIYFLSLLLGAVGFLMIALGTCRLTSVIAFILFGVAWIAIITIPFTILTQSLSGDNNGTLLGLYNCFICLPQIVASSLSFLLLKAVGGSMANMFYICASCFVLGAFSIWLVPDHHQDVRS
ncbi:MFS transporter [Fructobacillus sp. M1-13]|uniref:SLC45 family MFS transporter n=1 Tax=Fructobacillus papyriferae TaxID=2713171 RepID=A0ABS5QNH8_9LACO|nr:MFS transporter [Fructobacillus papyriferae]MBS9334669.1 SLC45 family MFS transporter [Fructobacillus papyriferae]MCD2158659.1 MFS transporter [Fructobacillus papyriferae]